jgi:hypothetical protein
MYEAKMTRFFDEGGGYDQHLGIFRTRPEHDADEHRRSNFRYNVIRRCPILSIRRRG